VAAGITVYVVLSVVFRMEPYGVILQAIRRRKHSA